MLDSEVETSIVDSAVSLKEPQNSYSDREDQVEIQSTQVSSHEGYPKWIGSKFEPDGTVLPFPGNTLICHLSPKSYLYQALLTFVDELKKQTFISRYALLPATSWHMTVFEGVSGQIRKAGFWPRDLDHDVPLQDCTNHFRQRLASFDLDCTPPFKMKIAGWEALLDGIALKVVPASTQEESKLRGLRDRVSEHLQTRYPGHETYSFHISLAYTLCFLTEEDQRATTTFLEEQRSKLPTYFELGAPEFCVFDDMTSFQREFFLK